MARVWFAALGAVVVLAGGCSSGEGAGASDPTDAACEQVSSLPNKPDEAAANDFAKVAEGADMGIDAAAERLVNTAKVGNANGWRQSIKTIKGRC